MSGCRDALAAALLMIGLIGLIGLMGLTTAQAADTYPRIGRPATAAERKAWDTDVRPDFKGLPKGAGSVAQGQVVWEAKCAGCHDVFCESNEVFTALVGPALRCARWRRSTPHAAMRWTFWPAGFDRAVSASGVRSRCRRRPSPRTTRWHPIGNGPCGER